MKIIPLNYINNSGMVQFRFSKILVKLYVFRLLRNFIFRLARKIENGEFYSSTIREILEKYHGVKVGAYSYGPCLTPGAFPSGVTVGRYVSIAAGVKIFLRNHPIKHLSLHPFFYNIVFGYIKNDPISVGTLHIGDDAWIGHGALITPGCTEIGIGAIVGAGAVVAKNVPDFAVVAGNPAKIIRFRFEPNIINKILDSEWWNNNICKILPYMNTMEIPLEHIQKHPLLRDDNI